MLRNLKQRKVSKLLAKSEILNKKMIAGITVRPGLHWQLAADFGSCIR